MFVTHYHHLLLSVSYCETARKRVLREPGVKQPPGKTDNTSSGSLGYNALDQQTETEKPVDETGSATSLKPGHEVPGTPSLTTTNSAGVMRAARPDFRKLDERVVTMWTTTALIGSGILLLVGIAGGAALWLFAGVSLLIIIPGWLVLALNFLLETRWLPRKRYESTCFRMGDGFFEFRSGWLWKTSVMIPISRLQHIDLLRGPWEQHYGLATLDLYTAGTRKASQKVPGLEAGTAIRIREELIEAAALEAVDPAQGRGQE